MASSLKSFLAKLRKRHIIETLAAFIGGGWLIYEIVERVLVLHYKFPEALLDITLLTVIAAMLCTILWRWFSGTEKRPGNVKIEVLIVPLVILIALAVDLNLILQIAGIPGKKMLIGIVAFLLGITWVIFKLSQWAAGLPEAGKKEVEVSPTAPAKPEKSIVVLPFVNISPEEGQDYFCDGMTEEIITDLSQVHNLLVISRSSAMTLKGSQKTIRDIANGLNVRYALEGSVRKAGNDLRITAQLIDADTDVHLWADKYSGTLNDIFDIQERVSQSIVSSLKLKLAPEESQRMFARPIANAAVYDLHIKARHEMWSGTEEGLERASQLIKNGIEIIGENEVLNADMGHIYLSYLDATIAKEASPFVKIEECIQKVFALNPESSSGHFLRGMVHRKRRNCQESVREFKQSLAKEPNNPDSIAWLSWVYSHSGKVNAARPLIDRLLEIDPLNPISHMWAGLYEMMHGKFDIALKALNKAYQLEENNPLLRYWYAKGLAYAQRYEEAEKLFDLNEKDASATVWAKFGSIFKYGLQQNKAEVLGFVTEEFKSSVKEDDLIPIWMAETYALIYEKSEAIDWIDCGIKSGFINYAFLMEYDPFLANIRNEPRFLKLMERVKYEWEHFEV